MRYILLAFLLGIIVGELDPVGRGIWRFVGSWLEEHKADSIASESPFSAVPRTQWVGESEHAFAIRDRAPRAPIHFLVISKSRYQTLMEAPSEVELDMLELAKDLARRHGIADSGFRLQVNVNPEGGQSVYHLHIHVLGGRQMREDLLPHLKGLF